MTKKTWVAPTVAPLSSAKDAQLGLAGAKDGTLSRHAATS